MQEMKSMRNLIGTSDMRLAMEKTQATYPVLRELANFIASGNRLPGNSLL